MKKIKNFQVLVSAYGREMREIYRGTELPVIGLTYRRKDGKIKVGHKVNLGDFENTLENLPEGSVFTIGRKKDNDVRPDFKMLVEWYTSENKGRSEEEILAKAEKFYSSSLREISRYHAAVERTSEGEYVIYDCSLFGTVIVPPEPKPADQEPTEPTPSELPQGEPEPAEPQVKRLPWWKKLLRW